MSGGIKVYEKKGENRSAGILLHVSSLPGDFGIGTLGENAYRFIDILNKAKISYWQVLPLVQTSFGDSPYQSVYSGSGNPYFIDPEILFDKGLLTAAELNEGRLPKNDIDYGRLYNERYNILRKAFSRFDVNDSRFVQFVESGRFEDYAMFSAIKAIYNGLSFDKWGKEFKFAEKGALAQFKENNKDEYLFRLFLQFEFFEEWNALKDYAHKKKVKIIGDMPLYVAYDSADVWANPNLFKLDENLVPKKVAGVPPDYFSETGQLWGNPVYDWKEHKITGYKWWIDRFRRAFEMYDVVRVDHFRGLDRYFEIDYGESTAINGSWIDAPKAELFDSIRINCGDLKIIAEDLGTLDEGVYKLMKDTGFPGMKVIEFAFDGNPNNPYLPDNIKENSVCYTGTHDNDTLVGYIAQLDDEGKKRLYSAIIEQMEKHCPKMDVEFELYSMAQAMKELAVASLSKLVILPMQDILLTGSQTRMNVPSLGEGNWRYRLEELDCDKIIEYGRLCKKHGRLH